MDTVGRPSIVDFPGADGRALASCRNPGGVIGLKSPELARLEIKPRRGSPAAGWAEETGVLGTDGVPEGSG